MATLLPELRAELDGLRKQIKSLEAQIDEIRSSEAKRERDAILLNKNDDLTDPTRGVPHVSA